MITYAGKSFKLFIYTTPFANVICISWFAVALHKSSFPEVFCKEASLQHFAKFIHNVPVIKPLALIIRGFSTGIFLWALRKCSE